MTIQEQYKSLDLKKLPKEVLREINEMKEDSQNFTEVLDFIQEDWDLLWKEVILKKYSEAINKGKSASKSTTSKPRATKKNNKQQETIEEALLNSPHVRKLMPLHQQRILKNAHVDTVKRLEKELKAIPKLYAQGGKSRDEMVVHAHYFYAQSDWFITEIDTQEGLFHGYTILNGDVQMSELGYMSIKELTTNKKVELDFYWKKQSLAEALYTADKDYFPEPKNTTQKEEKPKAKTTKKQPTSTNKKKTNTSQTKPRAKKATTTSIDIEKVAHYSEAYRLIRRFHNLIGKEVTFRKAQLLFWAFEKAIVARKVRKTSKDALLFKKVNEKVVRLFKMMESDEIKVIKQLTIKEQKLQQEIEAFVKGHQVDAAVRLLNRFIGLQGKKVNKAQAERLFKAIDKAIQTNAVSKGHYLYDELLKANSELNTFQSKGKPIAPSVQELSGIKKKAVTVDSPLAGVPIVNDELFTQATVRQEKNAPGTFRLKGEMGKFLQDLQRYRLAIVLTGDPHAGKSEFVKQIVNAFLLEGMSCGFFDLEQGGLVSKDTRASIDRNIPRSNQKNLFVAGEAPRGFETIKEFANQFDVVVIDSWQKLKIPNTRFDELRLEFPNTIFIVIFQQNGEGRTRGGVSTDYDAPVAIKVHKMDDTFVNNYAELVKNRGNRVGLQYLIAKKQIRNN